MHILIFTQSATFPLAPSTIMCSKFEKGGAHPPAIIIHPAETLALGDMFDINQEFFNMIKTGEGYLWRGWKGKFTPTTRGDNAVKRSGSSFGQSKSPDGKEIYSWCQLDCCRHYVESRERKVGSQEVETQVEAEEGLEWWEIGGDADEDGLVYDSESSEYCSDEDSDDCDEESEEEDSHSDDEGDDGEEEDSDSDGEDDEGDDGDDDEKVEEELVEDMEKDGEWEDKDR
ncbi:hypothetical protein HOY80DRAFT_1102786 [Tuber brumale]|nr:hypothetical protein HOY80DRAFT_1102786 [Tuber brumale]